MHGILNIKFVYVCDFCPQRKVASVRTWLTVIYQVHVPAARANKWTYFRRVVSDTHDVVLNLYETSLRSIILINASGR
jgi:hypothetical protein